MLFLRIILLCLWQVCTLCRGESAVAARGPWRNGGIIVSRRRTFKRTMIGLSVDSSSFVCESFTPPPEANAWSFSCLFEQHSFAYWMQCSWPFRSINSPSFFFCFGFLFFCFVYGKPILLGVMYAVQPSLCFSFFCRGVWTRPIQCLYIFGMHSKTLVHIECNNVDLCDLLPGFLFSQLASAVRVQYSSRVWGWFSSRTWEFQRQIGSTCSCFGFVWVGYMEGFCFWSLRSIRVEPYFCVCSDSPYRAWCKQYSSSRLYFLVFYLAGSLDELLPQ